MAYNNSQKVVYVSSHLHAKLKVIAAQETRTLADLMDSISLNYIESKYPKMASLGTGFTTEMAEDALPKPALDPTVMARLEAECDKGLETFIEHYRLMFHRRDPEGWKLAKWELDFREANGMEVSGELREAAEAAEASDIHAAD